MTFIKFCAYFSAKEGNFEGSFMAKECSPSMLLKAVQKRGFYRAYQARVLRIPSQNQARKVPCSERILNVQWS